MADRIAAVPLLDFRKAELKPLQYLGATGRKERGYLRPGLRQVRPLSAGEYYFGPITERYYRQCILLTQVLYDLTGSPFDIFQPRPCIEVLRSITRHRFSGRRLPAATAGRISHIRYSNCSGWMEERWVRLW